VKFIEENNRKYKEYVKAQEAKGISQKKGDDSSDDNDIF